MTSETPTEPYSRGQAARDWWIKTCHPEKGDRASRARLRRCSDWRDAITIPDALGLLRDLRISRHDTFNIEAGLNLAIVLSHVKVDDQEPLMRSAGFKTTPRKGSQNEDQPKLAVLRFTRLMRSTKEELPLALIRLVRLMKDEARISDLTDAMLNWSHPTFGDRVRRNWAFDYYAASDANPNNTKNIETTTTEGITQ
jgi:CRISPR type I-E-associated protein CasB/Cse2